MAPRFRKKDESVEAGFRRIALAEIEDAIAIIDARDRTDADKVHKVRRQMKSLRALLRLVRPAFGRFDKENRHFRDMARALSHTRDAKVMLDTFDVITGAHKGRPLPRGFAAMRVRVSGVQEAPGDLKAMLAGTRGRLVKAQARARRWELDKQGWAAIAQGLSQTYGDARETMGRALRTHDAEASHDWRKGVKYHGAQMGFVSRMRPGALGKRARTATRLGDLLGARHDIDMLLDRVARTPALYGDVITITQIAGLARLRAARLDRQARRIGEALFDEKADKLARHWGGWWEEWRG